MHFVICDAAGAVLIQGYSSEMVDPPLEPGQTLHWHALPLPFAAIDAPDPAMLFAEAFIRAEAEVRAQAERQRLRFISPGVGKAMAYQQKAAEAEAFLQAESPQEVAFPHIFGEARAMEIEPAAMAELILQLRDRWQVASAEIERIERQAVLAIGAAQTLLDLEAASAVDWSALDALAAAIMTSEKE